MVKATMTERNIPEMMSTAFSVLMYWDRLARVWSSATMIFMMAMATAAPNSSNTMETVVDVGMPKVLKKSSNSTSVTMTAMKMIMISSK